MINTEKKILSNETFQFKNNEEARKQMIEYKPARELSRTH